MKCDLERPEVEIFICLTVCGLYGVIYSGKCHLSEIQGIVTHCVQLIRCW